jgi:uncharacterized protein (DUF1501 family)
MTDPCPQGQHTRRRFLGMGAGALFGWSFRPQASSAATIRTDERRLFVMILRGGMDGLAAVAPIGDPAFGDIRHGLIAADDAPLLPLDSMFALNGNMPRLSALYRDRQALVIHATATPYRDRSHFEAQDMLESGAPALSALSPSGWLNRALQVMPRGDRLPAPTGLALEATTPLIIRGDAPVNTWQPQLMPSTDDDTVQRLVDLYRKADPALAAALERGVQQDMLTAADSAERGEIPNHPYLLEEMRSAAKLMARSDGPRIATMSLYGWDTHHSQGFEHGVIARQLSALDQAIAGLREGLGSVWRDTAVLVLTEFGRTVRFNGSAGTDHGTATTAFLVGGAVNGGRVVADWPGLAETQLYQKRDLLPTTDLRAVLKGVLADHLGVGQRALDEIVFPGSRDIAPLRNLCRPA